jgi:hypothetical protein
MTDLLQACQEGDLEAVRQLAVSSKKLDKAFQGARWRGHLEAAQYLVSLGGVDHHAEDEWAFRRACCYGQLVVRYLVSLGGVDYHHIGDEEAFRWACWGGHLRVAQYLVSLGGGGPSCQR